MGQNKEGALYVLIWLKLEDRLLSSVPEVQYNFYVENQAKLN